MRPLNKFERNWLYLIGIAVLALLVINFGTVLKMFGWVWNSFSIIVYSFALAYLLNIVMVRIDYLFDLVPETPIHKQRRIISLVITLIVVGAFLYLLMSLIIPQLFSACQVIVQEIPKAFESIRHGLIQLFDKNPQFQEYLMSEEIDWQSLFKTIGGVLTIGIGSVLNVTYSMVSGLFVLLMNALLIVILAVYILLDKERFLYIFYRLCFIYLDEEKIDKMNHRISVIDYTFSNFVTGKVIDALLVGCIVTGGMMLMKLPYPVMVGTLVGAFNVIPMVGAFIGGAIGAFMVFTVSPVQAIVFTVFICIIQQIDGNFLYPKIAGNTVGLPGVYVLMSIIVCGSLGGVLGIILGIPIVASAYKLIGEYLDEKELEKLENFKL